MMMKKMQQRRRRTQPPINVFVLGALLLINQSNAFAPSARAPLAGVRHHDRNNVRLEMSDEAKEETSNPLASLFNNFMQVNKEAAPIEVVETEEEKQKRLRRERLAEIEAGEIRRQERVAEDKFGYLFLFALQLLPLIGSDRFESILYFYGLAVTTVYLGGRQEVIDKPEKVSKDNALFAPIFASLSIGGLYALLKMGIDITAVYAIMVTIFGALAISGKYSSLVHERYHTTIILSKRNAHNNHSSILHLITQFACRYWGSNST